MKSETVRARVEPELKHEVQAILNEIGLSFSEAIELYLKQIKLHNGIPFELKIPNAETRKVLEESEKGININIYDNLEDFYKKVGI